MTRHTFSTFIIMLGISSTSYAYSSPYSPANDDIEKAISNTLFTQMDNNKDKKISFDEVFAYRAKEEKKQYESRANRMLEKCDKNKDGRISLKDEIFKLSFDDIPSFDTPPTEISECHVPEEVIETLDLNNDNYITKDEFLNSMAQEQGRPPKRIRKKQKERQEKRMAKQQAKQFKLCDKDNNQYLTLREAASMRCNIFTEMFDARDKDGDALISLQEMTATINPLKFDRIYNEKLPTKQHKIPPLISLDIKISECDKNENGKLELSETTATNCEVDLNFFNTIDRNNDRAVDRQEIKQARMKKGFDRLDKNKDGFLDKKEFKGTELRYL